MTSSTAPRRRRKSLSIPGQGESSREASCESNDETTSGMDEDDTASITAVSPLSPGETFETTSIPFLAAKHSHSPTPAAQKKAVHPSANPLSILGRQLPETDGEGEISEGSAGRLEWQAEQEY
ncbi:choline-phosphate cytidylyltransferase [Pseudohyphozyma bogoriensis]|nr:choline-phosphate cytidylyltransferase [Pseudohyphozyma bogoriensis]